MTNANPTADSQLTFALQGDEPQSHGNRFIVEIRRENGSFVNRITATIGITLGQGLYMMTARLPSGAESTRCVQVGAPDLESTRSQLTPDDIVALGTPRLIVFGMPSRPKSDSRTAFQRPNLLALRNWSRNFLSESIAAQSPASAHLESMGAEASDVPEMMGGSLPSRVTWYYGNPLSSEPLSVRTELPDLLPYGERLRVTAPPRGIQFAQWRRQHQLALNMLLPVCANSGCTVTGYLVEGEQPRLDVILDNPDADALVRYLQTGNMAEANTYFTAHAAHVLLKEKYDDPVGAVIGAYLLLRFRDGGKAPSENPQHWSNWTENLMSAFPTIADSLIIRAEQLSQQGRHREALDRLLQIPTRGLPMFSIGLSLAIDRLAFYWDVQRSGDQQPPSPFNENDISVISRLLTQLRSFGAQALYESPFLTYCGLDPTKPAPDVLGEDKMASEPSV